MSENDSSNEATTPDAPDAPEEAATPTEASAPEAQSAPAETPKAADAETTEAAPQAEGADAPAPEGGENPAPAGEASAADAPNGGEAAATAEGAAAAPEGEGEGGKKKKKRRRRKKKKKNTETDPAKLEAQVPFLKYFEARGGKAHAFSAGEVIAGRVTNVTEGAIFVDLFGKATAVADIYEPREVPVLPDPEPEPAPPAEGEAAAAPAEGEAAAAPAEGEAAAAPAEGEAAAAPAEGEAAAAPAEGEAAPAEARTTAVGDAFAPAAVEAPSEEAAKSSDAPATDDAAATATPEHAEIDEEAEAAELETTAGEVAAPEEPVDVSKLELPVVPEGPPPEPPMVGGIFRGRVGSVAESGHIVIINRIIDRPAAKQRVRNARTAKVRVQGLVYGFNRGGFDVLVDGIRAFCPARAMSLTTIENPEEFVGQKLEFTLPPLRGSGRSIIVSRRGILERDARKKAQQRMKELKVGEKLPGKVLEIRDYGVIVDIGGGVDGLVHQSEVSWNRGARMSDVVSVGQDVEVQVLKVQPATRKDRYGKLSLSIRLCLPDPWEDAKDVLTPGKHIEGKVVRTAEFGAFVELKPGVEGLLHITELGRDLRHAEQAVKEGQMLDVVIERVDKKARRVSLSQLSDADKQAIESGEFDPSLAPKSLKSGSHIKVQVARIEHHGIFVRVRGVLGKRGRGYVSNRDLPETEGKGGQKKKARLKVGDELDVKITGTDRDGRLRCSVKHRQFDDERRAVKEYRKEASKQGFGTFGDILRAKLETKDD